MNFDLVAIGGGFAGLTAALRATELGLKAAVLERGTGEHYKCNSRVCTGVIHVNYLAPHAPPDELYAKIMADSDGTADPALARALADNAARAVPWLAQHGGEFTTPPHRFAGQPMIAPGRVIRAGLDWEESGPNLLLKRLRRDFEDSGGAMMMGMSVDSLVTEDGRVTGVDAAGPDGGVRLTAGAVVLADGGFQAGRELITRHITRHPDAIRQRNVETGVGDGLRMAADAGAALVGLDMFYGHVLSRDAMANEGLWPYPQLDGLCAITLVVDGNGRRFADEGLGGIWLTNMIARLDDPLGAVMICDATGWEAARTVEMVPANPHLAEAGGTVLKADSLDALAALAGLNPAALSQTVASHNDAIAGGGLDRLEPPRTADPHEPLPVRDGPFYALPLCAGITVTMGGVSADGGARVVRDDGTAIAGLYAVGSTVGGIEGGPRAGYAGGLAKAFILGLIAADSAAADLAG